MERRRQLGRTHLHKPVPSIIHCDGARCCDRGCERRWLRCAGGGDREACDVVTFDLMESRRAECSGPFDGCSVASAKRMVAPVASSSTAVQLYPFGAHNCCWLQLTQELAWSRCLAAESLALTRPDEPSWDRA